MDTNSVPHLPETPAEPRPLKAYLYLHASVLLFGLTAVLGDLISLREGPLVWWRMVISSGAFMLGWALRRPQHWPGWRDLLRLGGIGAVLMVHWLLFYGSIKVSAVSVTLVCIASGALFTAVLEPLWFGRKVQRQELVLGVLVVVGIALVFNFKPEYVLGIVLALLSAVLSAVYGVLNKQVAGNYSPYVLNGVQLTGGALVLTAVLPFWLHLEPSHAFWPTPLDWVWLLLLSLLCTNFAYTLNLAALRDLSAFSVMLAINLEPLYGIALAVAFLGEARELGPGLLLGGTLVLGAVFIQPLLSPRFRKRLRRRRIPPQPPAG